MATEGTTIRDRVRENTPDETNMKMDEKLMERTDRYQNLSVSEINTRLDKVQNEWDIERALEVNLSSLALTGLVFGTIFSKKWYMMTLVVAGFLLQHGIQGWCPPLTLLRKLGFRTRSEIDEEIYALKTLRGDFDNINSSSAPIQILASFRR
ncbi:MAG TPA: YgaP-like transmembrane domain [Bacteroidales bacterium]|nr:YgaP-like transmembrane domain [Bacteroidales bacterium]